jgi:hypothetical protein
MLRVRYLHLRKAKSIHKTQTHPLVREDVTQELWSQRLIYRKKNSYREPQEDWRQDELIGRQPLVVI